MAETAKKVLEKKGQGEYEFTPYGEFLSYFHAHIDIFKRLLKAKKTDPAQIEAISKSVKAYMTANIKKTDHFFENLPQFSTMLGVPQGEISSYLNTNFIEVLGKVQEKLKAQELDKINNAPEQQYERITEEIIEKLKFVFPADTRFAERGILIVLENTKTGEITEPKGLMAESARAALAVSGNPGEKIGTASLTEALAQANAPPPPPVKKTLLPVKEKSILQEIVELFGDTLTGQPLEIQIGPPVDENAPIEEPPSSKQEKKDDYEIEDLDFEEDSGSSQSQNTAPEIPDGILDDIGGILDFDSTPEPEPEPQDPYLETVRNYSVREYIELTSVIVSYQQKADQVGYQNWLRAQPEFEKTVISFRAQLMKEAKAEPVDWNQVFQGISSKTEFTTDSLQLLQRKLRNFQIVKMTLDRTIAELKKGTPEFMNLVRMAWPHIQKAFFDVPNYEAVQRSLKGILSRVNEENHKKDLTRIFSQALNFIQSKYKD
ncbi:hypothetical protein LPTSP3_g12180 [Leptospira kobayashii]|uniref:Uncharacterized protein n=1 Tax=Leptospira kobayashii TaxID=1917830 RepID=A0ABM7UI58_9LEPT|nr:hypothetical protein [Leptospira kobayashii]BDA78288.1 hypothetical protein LPTSP3_g12180 [Leptospira kobayashii]